MDGLYNAESLCFVLSNKDRDFTTNMYYEQNPHLEDEHSGLYEDICVKEAKLSNGHKQLKSKNQELDDQIAALANIKDELASLKRKLETQSTGTVLSLAGQKRGVHDTDSGMEKDPKH